MTCFKRTLSALTPWLGWLLVLLSVPAPAAELRSIEVTHEDGVYEMTSVSWIDAPVQGVFDVLTDYDQFERVSSIYDDSHYLESADDMPPQAYTRVKGCVWFFCQTIERTEALSNLGMRCLRAIADPEASDFRFSDASWMLSDVEGGTEVRYAIVMEPAFFIPPLIGPYVLKGRLRSGGSDAIQRIETLAQASEADEKTFIERGFAMDSDAPASCEDWLAE